MPPVDLCSTHSFASCDRAADGAGSRSEAGFGSVLLVFCFGLGLYAMKSAIAPAIMSELFPTRLLCRGRAKGTVQVVATTQGRAPRLWR